MHFTILPHSCKIPVFPRECVSCVFDVINWLLTHWQFVCAFFVMHTKTAARTKPHLLYLPRSEDFNYLDDNTSINSVPVENRPGHKYLCWVFPWCIWFMSKTTTAHAKNHLRFAQIGFHSKLFWLVSLSLLFWGIMQHKFKKRSLEKKVFIAPIHQNI